MEGILLLLIGGVVIYFVVKRDQINQFRHKWDDWSITSYRLTLRYDGRSLSFDGDILGDETVITVIDDEISEVVGIHVDKSTLDEYERFTIDGLFEQANYYSHVQYDTVYGFPLRLGTKEHWVIEVTSFELLN